MSNILVIGSAHIDAVAVTEELLSDERPDVEGRVSFSLGGTAYNIAKNLAQNGQKVQLLTSLKENSITADLVVEHCGKFGIELTCPIYQQESEGGFAGHFSGTKVFKAVCEAAIERVASLEFNEALKKATKNVSTIVVDTNLQGSQLRDVLSKASSIAVPVIVAGVSVSRVKRINEAVRCAAHRNGFLIDVLCINISEAFALNIINCTKNDLLKDPLAMLSLKRLAELSVRRLVLTCGADGYFVFENRSPSNMSVKHNTVNINPNDVKSENGAGDAMVAAIASAHRDDYSVWESKIQKYVAPVLKVVSATTEDDLGVSNTYQKEAQWSGWLFLALSFLTLVALPIVGSVKNIGSIVTGVDLAFALTIILGLTAGVVGGRVRDLAAKLGFIDSKQFVSIGSAILPALSGLTMLFAFFALPQFATNSSSPSFSPPSHIVAALWFSIALVGGWFADLIASQRMQLKQLKKMVNSD